MSGNSDKSMPTIPLLSKETKGSSHLVHGLYAGVCQVEALQQAHGEIRKDAERLGIAPAVLDGIEGEGVEKFVRRLAGELEAGTLRLGKNADDDRCMVGQRIVEVALRNALLRAFPGASPCAPEPEAVAKWVAAGIQRGLSRVCALTLDAGGLRDPQRLVELASTRLGEAKVVALLRDLLAAGPHAEAAAAGILGPVLLNLAFQGLDHVLEQVKVLSRHGAVLHATGGRFGHDLILLVDRDVQHDWLVPAVRKRLAEEAAEIAVEIDAEKTQVVDLARGAKLRFGGCEFRAVKTSEGSLRVEYKPLGPSAPREAADAPPPAAGHLPGFEIACSFGRWVRRQPRWAFAVLGSAIIAAAAFGVAALFRTDGPRLYPVHGQVFVDGKPPTGALVVFHPSERLKQGKERPTGRVADDGSYVLGTYREADGAPAGGVHRDGDHAGEPDREPGPDGQEEEDGPVPDQIRQLADLALARHGGDRRHGGPHL